MSQLSPRFATYPILVRGGLDYGDGHQYRTKQGPQDRQNRDIVNVLHQIKGDNLVAQLVNQGKADFVCTVVAPSCAYRRVERALETPAITSDGLQTQQQIKVVTDLYAHPVNFQPSVVTNTCIEPFVAQSFHGVDRIWIGERVKLPVAALIAVEPFWSPKTIQQSILRVTKAVDGSLRRGSFEVTGVPEEGFYFRVEVEGSLFEALRKPASVSHRDSIYSMALAQGLHQLHLNDAHIGSEDWKEHQNLKLLYQMLKDRDVATWDEDDFRANQAVAAFHPHVVATIDDMDSLG
ncbi:MAG: hypothetical protein OXB95_05275 [Rhodobacteraceae bacterium]|nr:hypothetical protein [Paracoccaceae bacterium]